MADVPGLKKQRCRCSSSISTDGRIKETADVANDYFTEQGLRQEKKQNEKGFHKREFNLGIYKNK
jgi:hypothetical protein